MIVEGLPVRSQVWQQRHSSMRLWWQYWFYCGLPKRFGLIYGGWRYWHRRRNGNILPRRKSVSIFNTVVSRASRCSSIASDDKPGLFELGVREHCAKIGIPFHETSRQALHWLKARCGSFFQICLFRKTQAMGIIVDQLNHRRCRADLIKSQITGLLTFLYVRVKG